MNERMRAAIHEAGHAVYARNFGAKVDFLAIYSDGGGRCNAYFGKDFQAATEAGFWVAGIAAAEQFAGGVGASDQYGADHAGFLKVLDKRARAHEHKAIGDEAINLAHTVITKNKSQVMTVAEALYERGRLEIDGTINELEEVLNRVG